MENLSEKVEQLKVADSVGEPKQKFGLQPLAAKKPRNTKGTPIMVETNIRKLTIKPNQPIYKYAVQVIFVYKNSEGVDVGIEKSKSIEKGTKHENDKSKCQLVYEQAVKRYKELREGGPYFYDRQASLYSLTRLKNEDIAFSVTDVSRRANFVRADFVLKKVDESFQSTSNDVKKTVNPRPALADRTLLEAMNVIVSGPAFENKNVVTVGACVHYLIDPSGINVPFKEYQEGGLYSGVGASKAVKTLEGPAASGKPAAPSLYMTCEMKTTLFHPDFVPLISLFGTYHGFSDNLKSNSPAAVRMSRAFLGLDVVCDYGPFKGLREDGLVLKIKKFGGSARETTFDNDGKKVTVEKYFKDKYNLTLKYPNLFTIEAKGKTGKINLPAEVLLMCPSQTVTNDQMINNEQADMIKLSAAQPHVRKDTTDAVVKAVGLASNIIYDFVKVDGPEKVQGVLLDKPKILFSGNRQADLNNPRSKYPTDFTRAGQFFIPKTLQNWEICFVQGEEVQGIAEQLTSEMSTNGMKVSKPAVSYIVRGNLEAVFANAKNAKRELLFFVTKSRYNFHQEIKALEQKHDLLTQDLRYETAEKCFRQPQTRQNIVNKTNMKLGGLNYLIGSDSFKNPGRLIIGFETSSRGAAGGDLPICVGYAANMLDHFQKFAGGYVYVPPGRNIYGSIITPTIKKILETVKKTRTAPPSDLFIYINGVSEGQFALINEEFSVSIKNACAAVSETFRPHITIIAASKTHNERIYNLDKGRISNPLPGTVIDHTIVSPVYNEFYLASAVARQGTTKTTKFTLVFSTNAAEPMSNIEQLTNDLCYDHQIVFHPVGLPVPLYIAGRYSQRGAAVLSYNGAVYEKSGEVNYEVTNKELGYGDKKLFTTRFNA